MDQQSLQPFNELVCGFDRTMCQRVGMPIARRASEAVNIEPEDKDILANSNIFASPLPDSSGLDNDVNKIDGVTKESNTELKRPGALNASQPKVVQKLAVKKKAVIRPSANKNKLTANPSQTEDEKKKPIASGLPNLTQEDKKLNETKPDATKPQPVKDASNIEAQEDKKLNVTKTDAIKLSAKDEDKKSSNTGAQPQKNKKPAKKVSKPINLLGSSPQEKTNCQLNRRKEIRELTTEELKAYIDAIKALHKKKSPEQESKYDSYAAIHVREHRYIHGAPAFLPWHRQFIREYELDLQRINPAVTLPYWDWTIDSQDPHKSPVLTSAMFGGNGNATEDMCVTDGPFARWMVTTPEPHCLRRDFRDGTTIPALTPIDVMIGIVADTKDYEDFVFDLEVHHGPLHLDVGGDRGDLNPMQSPNDPLFFLHHTFIDMLWYNWQMKHPKSKAYGGKANGKPVSLNDKLDPYNKTVRDVLNTRAPGLCYFYDPYHPKVGSLKKRTGFSFETLSTQNLTRAINPSRQGGLKPVEHLPVAWLKMNNLDINRAREVEKERDTTVTNLNALGIPPASTLE